jgi:hypothetical protein
VVGKNYRSIRTPEFAGSDQGLSYAYTTSQPAVFRLPQSPTDGAIAGAKAGARAAHFDPRYVLFGGDSISVGMLQSMPNSMNSRIDDRAADPRTGKLVHDLTVSGRSPELIYKAFVRHFAKIAAAVKEAKDSGHTPFFIGSLGVSNTTNPKELLEKAGFDRANIAIVGTGTRHDVAGRQPLVEKIAMEQGVRFTGSLVNLEHDGVHPTMAGYKAITGSQAPQQFAAVYHPPTKPTAGQTPTVGV